MKCENLEQVRENIDRIDNEIIKLMINKGMRMASLRFHLLVIKVGGAKFHQNI